METHLIQHVFCIERFCPQRKNAFVESSPVCDGCGASLLIGGRYFLVELIHPISLDCSSEGYGTEVFKAFDVNESVCRAVKIIRETSGKDSTLFDRESEILLMDLEHESICKAYSCCTYISIFQPLKLKVLVLEFIDGYNLNQWLEVKEMPLTSQRATEWLKSLLTVLEYIHSRRVLHLDIKPSNIMLRNDGRLVLIDFGIAKRIPTTASMAYPSKCKDNGDTSTIAFTFDYAPPEQKLGKTPYTQSDIFALGRTFVHLLTGSRPSTHFIKRETETVISWRSQALSPLSPSLANWVDRMMAIQMEDRPQCTLDILTHYQDSELTYPQSSFIAKDLVARLISIFPIMLNLILFFFLILIAINFFASYEEHRQRHRDSTSDFRQLTRLV